MNTTLKKALPYVLAVIAFAVLAYAYAPELFKGKIVNQSDISAWNGMANEIVTYNQEHPDDPTYWTNSMFSGMPAVPISIVYQGDYTEPLYKLLFVGERPASYLLISLIGSFLMFLAFGANVYLSILGAIAVTFCSYNMQIIQVGHNSKMVAIALMPWVIAALVYAYRKKPVLGSVLFAFALSFQIKANHPQITYYLAIIVLGYAIARLVMAIKDKTLPAFFKTSALLLVCGLIGIATNINHLWPTYEYAGYSMRGGSELTIGQNPGSAKSGSGLDIEYATAWSYSPGETMNLLIPDFKGGASVGELDRDSETYKALVSNGYQGAGQIIRQMPLYWGEQPFTAGPMYLGAVTIFLFVLGCVLYKGPYKWWLIAVSVLAILLSWGYHLLFLTEFFFDYVPMYSKFRTVSMILVILQMTVPLLGILVLDKIFKGEYSTDRFRKGFIIATGVTAGLILLFALIPSLAGNFISQSDSSLPQVLAQSLREDRADLLVSDAWRSFGFVIVASLVLYLGWNKTIKYPYSILLLALLVLFDMWGVDKRYLNNSHFIAKQQFENQFEPRTVDKLILEDDDPDYRVLDMTVNTFNDAHPSYFHKTIGGYSPAKLQRYQDLITYGIAPEMSRFGRNISKARTLGEIEDSLAYYPILSMLNTKYIIVDPTMPPVVNRHALGNAWFVSSIENVADADEEILKLSAIDPSKTAVIADEFGASVEGLDLSAADSAAVIELLSYAPNRLKYSYSSSTENLAVFSEVYYPAGWRAYVDGKEADILRADYVLRALRLPAGTHEIEFYFQPESILKGQAWSRCSSGILLLMLLGVIGVSIRKKYGRAIEA